MDPSIVSDLSKVAPALLRLRLESAHKDRGFNRRQLVTRSLGETRTGEGNRFGVSQRPALGLAQILAAYLSCLPARVAAAAAAAAAPPAEDGPAEGGSEDGGSLGRRQKGEGRGKAEPVREVLRALGLVFHLETLQSGDGATAGPLPPSHHRLAGRSKGGLLDEAAWRAVLMACGLAPGFKGLAVKVSLTHPPPFLKQRKLNRRR